MPGNLPIGCSAVYLTVIRSQNKEDYDNSGCLKPLNDFAHYYNQQLNIALETLRRNNPHARIIYADYYGAALRFYHAPGHYGYFFSSFLVLYPSVLKRRWIIGLDVEC